MPTPTVPAGEVFDSFAAGQSDKKMTIIMKSDTLEVFRLDTLAGFKVLPHRAHGLIVVQCLKGRVAFTALDKTQELRKGQMLYLPPEEKHSLEAIDDASLLVTVFFQPIGSPKKASPDEKSVPELDVVQEASEESFPASDAPSWIPVTHL